MESRSFPSQTTANDGDITARVWSRGRHGLKLTGLGYGSLWDCVQGLKNLFDLPQMAALMCCKNPKRSIHVVADTSIDRRFDAYIIQRQTDGRLNGFHQAELRFVKCVRSRCEIVTL